MPPKLKAFARRFSLEFLKLHREVLGIIIAFSIVIFGYLALMAPTSDAVELQPFMSFVMGVLMPLLLSLVGNFILFKEVENGSIDFIRTRQSMERLWLYRIVGFLLLSALANIMIVSISNLIYGPILPPIMMFTLFVPTLFFSGLMGVATGITKNAYVGAGVGITSWLYFYLHSETMTTRLTFNDIVYYPFLEWMIYRDRPYMIDSLLPNRLVISAISVLLLILCYWLYKKNLRYVTSAR